MKLYSMHDGERLVRAARNTIELFLTIKSFRNELITSHLEDMTQSHGVYVTIEHYPTKALRGCMGFPRPKETVKEMVVQAAIAAATEDPRFVQVSHLEFEHTVVSVNVLSKLEHITQKGDKLIESIDVNHEGLYLEYGYHSGILLPIFAIENRWSADKCLGLLCESAGLAENTWKHNNINLYKFETQLFRELSPRGPIEEIVFE